MTYISEVPEEKADANLRQIYAQIREEFGPTPSWTTEFPCARRLGQVSQMRARWVSERPNPELPTIVGQAIVASWWPGKYYFVSTIQVPSSSPLALLAQSLINNTPYEEVKPGLDVFITQVFRCDENGWAESFDNPLYEREYVGLAQAKLGHSEVVDLLAAGKLTLRRRKP